jgi:hypothetical protein
MACTLVTEPLFVEVMRSWSCAHLRRERRLVTDGARDAAEERGHLRAGLREPEDVVDEEDHVLALFVAEVLGDREGREGHAGARAGGLVHLPEHERRLRDDGRARVELRLAHLEEEVVALAGALADAREAGHAAVRLRDVVDELQDEDGLADAGAAEEADLAALAVRGEQVDHLDARLEDLDLRRLVDELRGRPVDRQRLLRVDRAGLVDGRADDVEDAAEHLLADGHHDRGARVLHLHAADEAVGGVHRDGAHARLAQVLRDLEHEVVRLAGDRRVREPEGVQDLRELARGKLDVDDGADYLRDFSEAHRCACPEGAGGAPVHQKSRASTMTLRA